MNKLETGHATVQGLLNLSNDYLAGVGAFPPNFGNLLNFPSGVYSIVLQQGKDLQTLRMVKVAN